MKNSWTKLRRILSASPRHSDLFLSLIDENGKINSVNHTMSRQLELKTTHANITNFFDLVHPVNREDLRQLVTDLSIENNSADIEIYVRNGHYHPMKWEVNFLDNAEDGSKTYFCLGYKLLDEVRQQRFNHLVENHHQLIIESLSGIIFHDTRGELIAANQKAANIFGTTLERLYQLKDVRTLWDSQWVITDEEGKRITFDETPFLTALATGKTQRRTLQINLSNGDKRWVLFNSQVLNDEQAPEKCAVVSSIIDVTKERSLSAQLKDREALIHDFLRETPNLAWIVDEDEKLLFASGAFFQYFDLEPSCIGQNVTKLVPGAITQAVYKHHLEVLESGQPVQTTQEIKLANGTSIISHINIFPINTISGKRLMGGQSVSLADKSRLETELHKVQERLITLSRATSDAIWEWDMQSGQMYRNESLMEMIGYQPDNSKGLSWWLRRVHPEDRNRVADKVKEATDNMQQSWQDRYRFKCADGSYKHIQDRGFVVYENGLPVKMIGSLQDVSAVRDLEEKLDDERLHKQKEISEAVIQVAEQERTRIGHELHDNVNQIISTAKLFVDMLVPATKEQQQAKEKSIDYLLLAIEEIRQLSRELVAPALKEESLANSIKVLVEDIEMVHDMEIRFTHDLETDLLSEGKKVTLFRIVQEQLKNIIKHSGATSTTIFLQVKDGMAQLIVSDNGSGFEPKQTYQGIGLSNIYERTKFYNGQVDIQAAKGKGCRMTVTIPVEE